MQTLRFSVDSQLLIELGQRLVGRPYIALAELIKNAYDADATRVTIYLEQDRIVVEDNGHGMSLHTFRTHWMRIGTTHKRKMRVSPTLGRPLTGSKGIGRLAAQFLADKLQVETQTAQDEPLRAAVNWTTAQQAGELTNVEVGYETFSSREELALPESTGTRLVLEDLRQEWDDTLIEELAAQVWSLRPPLGENADASSSFEIEFHSQHEDLDTAFHERLHAILDIWHAKISGELANQGNELQLDLEFRDGPSEHFTLSIDAPRIHRLSYVVHVFALKYRQPHGISVQDARDYLDRHGGIQVFDADFRLPYYGQASGDWLETEQDHARRKAKSRLLPSELHTPGALTYLPTRNRTLGIVRVDTGLEANTDSHSPLSVQISRDRLVANAAYAQLRDHVRIGLDFFAAHEARRRLVKTKESLAAPDPDRRLTETIKHYRADMTSVAYRDLSAAVRVHARHQRRRENLLREYSGLLAALATAGMSALAYEHEASKQHTALERISRRLAQGRVSAARAADRLRSWIERARGTRKILQHLLEPENRTEQKNFRAQMMVKEVTQQVSALTRSAKFEFSLPDAPILLPSGTFAEWSAVLQNLLLNAVNATLDSKEPRIRIRVESDGKQSRILIEDNGVGVEVDDSERLFEPFVREARVHKDRHGLLLGGTGLGLTIVRLVGEELGATIRFVRPEAEWRTCAEVRWETAQ